MVESTERDRAAEPVAVEQWEWCVRFTVGGDMVSMPGPLVRIAGDLAERLPGLVVGSYGTLRDVVLRKVERPS